MSNANRIADLVQITNRLSDLLEHESAILRTRKLTDMEAVRQDKIALSATYETHVRTLRSQPDMLADATPEMRQKLKAAFERLEKDLGENERGLRAAKETSNRVLRAIADEVDRQRRENMAYSPNGYSSVQPIANSQAPVSVAIDEHF